MNDDSYVATDRDLQTLRRLDPEHAADLINYLLGTDRLPEQSQLETRWEVEEFLATGDVGAARALIQHASGRHQRSSRF